MTYINKGTRLFLDRGDIKLERRRSESRLKTYPSAIDIRAWCDIVEDRRQHILELINKGKGKCFGSLIPVEAIVDALLAGKVADIQRLQTSLAQLWKFIEGLNLDDQTKQKLAVMRQNMDPICISEKISENENDKKNMAYSQRNLEDVQESNECVAKARHEKELEEINALIDEGDMEGGTYKLTTKGPAKIVSRIKGIRPGFKIVPGATSESVATRAQGPARVKIARIENVAPILKSKGSAVRKGQIQQIGYEEKPQGQDLGQPIPGGQPLGSRQGPPQQQLGQPGQGLGQGPFHQGQPLQGSVQGQRYNQPTGQDQLHVSGQGQPQQQFAQPGQGPIHPGQPLQGLIQGQRYDESSGQGQFQEELFEGQEPGSQGQHVRRPLQRQQGEQSAEQGLSSQDGYELQDGEFGQLISSSLNEENKEDKTSPVTRPKLIFSKSSKPEDLIIQLEATETLCNELQATLENIKNERDNLKKKYKQTLDELEAMKKLNSGTPIIPTSCKEEIEALELEIKVMRSGNLSPEQEAEVIKKEVDVLKKYCMKLKSVEDENEKLKLERDTLKSQVTLSDDKGKEKPKSIKDNLNRQVAGISGDTDGRHKSERGSAKDIPGTVDNIELGSAENTLSKESLAHMDELKSKLKDLDDIIKERDMLANKVQRLERELLQYRDLPEDIDVYRNRSKMLDNALEERDKMSKKVEQIKEIEDELNKLKKKSARIDDLEEELKLFTKNGKNIGSELKKSQSRCTCLERELQNVKMERDSMRTRIEYMKKEIEMLRTKGKEAEIYKLERDKLQIRVNELSQIQAQYEDLLLKCKCLENSAAERDMYKQKYEEILTTECQGDMLRSQLDAAKCVERERNALVKQVGDLECCICDQEEEIKKLVMQIDSLCRGKDENQCRMREALASMRAEIEKKDCLIAESEEKLTYVQAQLKSSIQGVSCETTCYKTRIEELERQLKKSNALIETLQKQLNKINSSSIKNVEKFARNECETVATMKRELDTAKAENKKLREIANKMATLTGDEHVQNMLKQSQCAVKRVVEELGRQYKEWDNLKKNQKKGIHTQVTKQCLCKNKHIERHSLSDTENEKLIEELEDIQREKEKLEQLVKQIQNDKISAGPQNE